MQRRQFGASGEALGTEAFGVDGVQATRRRIACVLIVQQTVETVCDAGHQHGTWADSAGTVEVQELDWTKPEQVGGAGRGCMC